MRPAIRGIHALCCLFSLCAFTASAHSFSRTVSVQVEPFVESKRTSEHTVAEDIVLRITLRGKPLNSETRTVQWMAFGRDRASGDISVIHSGETKVDLTSVGTQKLESDRISATSTKRHHNSRTSGQGRRRRTTYTEVEGVGIQYIGYGVRILESGRVVGEMFEPARLESALDDGAGRKPGNG